MAKFPIKRSSYCQVVMTIRRTLRGMSSYTALRQSEVCRPQLLIINRSGLQIRGSQRLETCSGNCSQWRALHESLHAIALKFRSTSQA